MRRSRGTKVTNARMPKLSERLRHLRASEGGPLLVLRAFLGVTFTFAGLQKLANPRFFRASSPTSIQAQLAGSMATSPIRPLLHLIAHAPVLFGVVIAIAEVAVGVGTILGLASRLAALGGMVLSASFFLTISYATSPYYYGSDIVFVFAWTPLVIAGAGALSLDAWLTRPAQDADRSTAMSRRTAVGHIGAFGLAGLFTAVVVALDAGLGRAATPTASSASRGATGSAGTTTAGETGTTSATASGQLITESAKVPVGGALAFTDARQGIPAYVLQPEAGSFTAFSAVCTHAGCTVGFEESSFEFVCPCHGSVYNAHTGAVLAGPAPLPLPRIEVTVADDKVYAED
jgi:thiosulfate dehydrogenase [quinone] large subunit